MPTLNRKKAIFTKNLLLNAACELIQTLDIDELSFKNVSDKAEISQRTMFRYFQTRDEFLDALTERLYSELNLPDIPNSAEKLVDYLRNLYQKLDEQPRKVSVLLSADLLPRIISTTAKARFDALKQLLIRDFPRCSKSDVIKTAANLRYVMSASSWRYYRVNFEFDLKTSQECAIMMIEQALNSLAKKNSESR